VAWRAVLLCIAGMNSERATRVLAQNFRFSSSVRRGRGACSFDTRNINDATIRGSDSSEADGNLRHIRHMEFPMLCHDSGEKKALWVDIDAKDRRISILDDGSDS